jgi:hypothetical protein
VQTDHGLSLSLLILNTPDTAQAYFKAKKEYEENRKLRKQAELKMKVAEIKMNSYLQM